MESKLINSILTDYVSTWSSRKMFKVKQENTFGSDQQIEIIDCSDNRTIFQLNGEMSITIDNKNHQIKIMVKDGLLLGKFRF